MPDVAAALSLLDQANTQFKEVLASLGSQTASAAAVQSRMVTFLGALQGIQQHLDAFASTTSSRQQQLHKEIRSLEQELQQADQLLLDADLKVNDWQADIQILRTAHEEVLTDSGSSSAQAQAAAATATATAAANGGPDHIDLTEGI